MQKLTLFLLSITFISQLTFSQCTQSFNQYGGGTAPANLGDITTMSTCNYYGEYGPITGLLASTQYIADIDDGGYITVFDGLGSAVAFGPTPLTFTPPSNGNYNIQWNGVGCSTDFNCHETFVENGGPSVACSNPALAGSTVSSVAIPCTGQNFTLSLEDATLGTGMTYQWQSSTDGINYSDISGATSHSCATSQLTATYYQCIVTCSAGTPATSTPIQLAIGSCIIMSTGSESTCSANFFDSGASGANYTSNEIYTLTITPSTPVTLLQISFSMYDAEYNYDEMTVYNGNSTAAPLMGSFYTNPGSITSTAADGSLTLNFTSDGIINYQGWEAQITCVTPPSNDIVCNAINIPVDGSVSTFNNGGASIEIGESAIAPPVTGSNEVNGWDEGILAFTTWFTFIAPPSGNVSLNCTGIEFNGQAAIYEATDCSDFSTFTFLSGNDNSVFGSSSAPEYKFCGLTSGNTYYLLFDSGNTLSSGAFSLSLDELYVSAGNFVDTIDVCSGDSAILFDGIENYTYGGVWTAEIPFIQTGLQDSLLNTSGMAFQTLNFQYMNIDACAMDSIWAQVRIWGPSNAGEDGSLMVCRNEPIDLLSGLGGNVDMGGQWYNSVQQMEPNSLISASNNQGSYNYDYIVSNGVCANDTSNVLVLVDGDCNYLSLEENTITTFELLPNPTNGNFTLHTNSFEGEFYVKIKDLQGKIIHTSEKLNGNGSHSFDLSNQNSGMYLVHIFNESTNEVVRIIKE